jgi:hypothetical protein
MKSNLLRFSVLLGMCLAFVYCDRPKCSNNNPVFEQNQPSSEIYKAELVRQLQQVDQNKLRYWFNKYEESNGEELLHFNIQGDGLCAVIVLTSNNWQALDNLRKVKGKGYRGAKFTKLKYEIVQRQGNTQFLYTSHGNIRD